MSSNPRSRQRAVKLTPEALKSLRKAVEEQWRESGLTSRLTRPVRAELMGVSGPTSDRILAGKGVDRPSLVQVFKSLGMPWDDAFCEWAEVTEIPNSMAELSLAQSSSPDIQSLSASQRTVRVALVVVTTILVSFAFAIMSKRNDMNWTIEYDRELSTATNFYAKGAYGVSEAHLTRAMQISEEHETSRNLEAALKLRGDISAARGRLVAASDYYKAALRYRELKKRPTWGPLHETLGTVQVRLKQFDQSKVNLDLAIDAFTKSREPNGIAEVLRDRGCLSAAMSHPKEALDWFAKSLQILSTQNAQEMVMDVRGERAMVFIDLGRVNEARKELQVCFEYWTKLGQPRWTALLEMRLGLAEAELDRKADAVRRISHAREVFAKVGDEARVSEADGHLSTLAKSR